MTNEQHPNLFNAIKAYVESTNALADAMLTIKNKHGRQTLEDITGFDVSRINTLCRLGNLPVDTRKDLLPETLIELAGEPLDDAQRYANRARKEKLKPSQLRKVIRQSNKTLITKDKPAKINDFGKQLLMMENSIKQMNSSARARALASLTNSLLS